MGKYPRFCPDPSSTPRTVIPNNVAWKEASPLADESQRTHWDTIARSSQAAGLGNPGVLDHSFADGVTRKAGHVVKTQLVHELPAMLFDRLDAEAEFGGDLLVGAAFGDQLEHLQLARGQVALFLEGLIFGKGLTVLLEQPFGDGRTEEGVAFPGFADSGEHVLRGVLLDQVADRAGLDQLAHILVVAVAREDDDFRPGTLLDDLPGGLQPV